MGGGPGAPRDDRGATLVELIVALAVLSVAMAGLGAFFVNSFLAVAQNRDHRQAAQVASGALEQVRALKGSSLLSGRGAQKVADQWSAARSGRNSTLLTPYLDSMQMVSDPDSAADEGADAPVPTSTQSMTVGGMTFERTILVGACEVYFKRTDACVDPTKATRPAETSQILEYFRVVVLVTWPQKRCADGRCSFVAATLVSRAAEPTFDFHRPSPLVKTTSVTFYQNVSDFSFQLDASGGQLPNSWTIAKLPAGLIATPAGVISGTPTTLGKISTTVTVTDKLGRADTEPIDFFVVPLPGVTGPADARNYVDDTVALKATGANGAAPYTWAATGLPDGLTIDETTGAITGTVTKPGVFTPEIKLTDANGRTATRKYTHAVYEPLTLPAIDARRTDLGSAFSAAATAAGGDGAYTYSASGLPLGVSINSSSGVMSGTPSVSGRYLPVVAVTDGAGGKVTGTFELIVESDGQLAFTSPSYATADRTSALGAPVPTLTLATNAESLLLKNVTFSVSGLPTGLRYTAGRNTITGTPTAAGTYVVTATASTLLPPQSTVLTFVWTVA